MVRASDFGPRDPGSSAGRAPFVAVLSKSLLSPAKYWLNPGSGGRRTDIGRL